MGYQIKLLLSPTDLKVTFDFIEYVLTGSSQQNCTSRRILALLNEREVLFAKLTNLEETASGSDIGFGKFVRTVDDDCTTGASDTIVVGLADTADSRNARLDQEVLGEIGHTLLRDHEVGFQFDDVVAYLLDVIFFHSKDFAVCWSGYC